MKSGRYASRLHGRCSRRPRTNHHRSLAIRTTAMRWPLGSATSVLEDIVAEVRVELLRVERSVEGEAGHLVVAGDTLDLADQRGTTTLSGALRGNVDRPQLRCLQHEGADPHGLSIQLGHKADLAVGVEGRPAQVLVGCGYDPTLDVMSRVVTRGEPPHCPFVNLQIQADLVVMKGANGQRHAADCSRPWRRSICLRRKRRRGMTGRVASGAGTDGRCRANGRGQPGERRLRLRSPPNQPCQESAPFYGADSWGGSSRA